MEHFGVWAQRLVWNFNSKSLNSNIPNYFNDPSWLEFQFPRELLELLGSKKVLTSFLEHWILSARLFFPVFFSGIIQSCFPTPGINDPGFPPKKKEKRKKKVWDLIGGVSLGFFFFGNKWTFSRWSNRDQTLASMRKKTRRGKTTLPPPKTNPKKFHTGKERQLFHKIKWKKQIHFIPLSTSPNPSLEWKENSKFQPDSHPSEPFPSLRKTHQNPHPGGNSGGFYPAVWKRRGGGVVPKLNP